MDNLSSHGEPSTFLPSGSANSTTIPENDMWSGSHNLRFILSDSKLFGARLSAARGPAKQGDALRARARQRLGRGGWRRSGMRPSTGPAKPPCSIHAKWLRREAPSVYAYIGRRPRRRRLRPRRFREHDRTALQVRGIECRIQRRYWQVRRDDGQPHHRHQTRRRRLRPRHVRRELIRPDRRHSITSSREFIQVPTQPRGSGIYADCHQPSFDHLVGGEQKFRRNLQPKHLGGLQVDHELVLGGLLIGQIAGLLAA